MKRIGLVLLISGFWLLVSGLYISVHAQETIEILTYYPAPYGVYQDLFFTDKFARHENIDRMYGDNDINLGGNSTTGASGENYQYCTVSGGQDNTAGNDWATVSGGRNNNAGMSAATIAGGQYNSAGNSYATVSGGQYNTAEGLGSTIAGGEHNTASAEDTFAAGRYAYANADNSFVWGGLSGDTTRYSNGERTFNIYADEIFFQGTLIWPQPSDVAEFMDILKKDKLEEGMLVSINTSKILGRSSKPYDENLIGVISGARTTSIYLGISKGGTETIEKLPVTLVGIVYVKVCNENGSIKLGDPITSCSIPGVGMKATKTGKIIGYALEEFNSDEGEILIFANLGYYMPKEEYFEIKKRLRKIEKLVSLLPKE